MAIFDTLGRWLPIVFAVSALFGLAQHGFSIDFHGAPRWLYEQYSLIRLRVFSLLQLLVISWWSHWRLSAAMQDVVVAYTLIGMSVRRAERLVDAEMASRFDALKHEMESGAFKLEMGFSLPPLRPSFRERAGSALREMWGDLRTAIHGRLTLLDLVVVPIWPLSVILASRYVASARHGYVPTVFHGFTYRKLRVAFGVLLAYCVSVAAFLLWSYLSA
jgi:hypothetical protein